MEIVNEEDPKKERKCTSSIRLSLGGKKDHLMFVVLRMSNGMTRFIDWIRSRLAHAEG